MDPGPQGPSPRGGSGPVAPVQLTAPSASCLQALGSQGAPTRGCSFHPCLMGLACSPRSRPSPTLRSLPAGALRPPGPWPGTPGRLVSPSTGGASGGPLAPVTPPVRRPVAARVRSPSRQLRHLTSWSSPAGLPGIPSRRGAAGGAAICGPSQGGRICRQTCCRVSSLCLRAARAALFSSAALHSSAAHWLRSAACPAAQAAATLPSSGVSSGSPPSPRGVGPPSTAPGSSQWVGGHPGSQWASPARSSL